MSHCEEWHEDFVAYLDNTLTGEKLESFRGHLAECSHCRERLEEELALSSLFRETQPLFQAPQGLRDRVAEAVKQAQASDRVAEARPASRIYGFTKWLLDFSQARSVWKPLVAVALVLVLSLAFVPDVVQRVRAKEYVDAATEIHKSFLNGDLPLQCETRSPDVVTAWFTDKTAFHFQLPTAQEPQSKPVYWLTGARVVSYKGAPAALVAYEMASEKITLLVVSAKSAVVGGGEEVRSGGLTFHYRRDADFQVVTWTNHDLTYALVSSLVNSAQHPCLVCHQDMSDHTAFEARTSRGRRGALTKIHYLLNPQ